jgi:hypothetical protein
LCVCVCMCMFSMYADEGGDVGGLTRCVCIVVVSVYRHTHTQVPSVHTSSSAHITQCIIRELFTWAACKQHQSSTYINHCQRPSVPLYRHSHTHTHTVPVHTSPVHKNEYTQLFTWAACKQHKSSAEGCGKVHALSKHPAEQGLDYVLTEISHTNLHVCMYVLCVCTYIRIEVELIYPVLRETTVYVYSLAKSSMGSIAYLRSIHTALICTCVCVYNFDLVHIFIYVSYLRVQGKLTHTRKVMICVYIHIHTRTYIHIHMGKGNADNSRSR